MFGKLVMKKFQNFVFHGVDVLYKKPVINGLNFSKPGTNRLTINDSIQDGSVRIQQQGFAVPPDNVAYTSNYQQATSPQYSPLCVHQGQPSYGAIPQYQDPVVDYGAQLVQSEVN